jgi:hypothetical protein
MSTNRILGRTTAGTGAVEEISVGTGLSLSAGTLSSTVTAGVTNVTATAPLTSSGGATPDISTSMATSRLLGRTTAGTGVAEEISTAGTLTLTGGTLTGTGVGGSVGAVDNAVLRADVGPGVVQNSSIIIDDETTATQNNVAIRNNDSQTNSALVLSPKGTGALLAQKPDGTTTGGNARGSRAVDLQLQRSSAAEVASGANSFSAGQGNTASSPNSVAIGNTNTASGGGNANGNVALGANNTSSGGIWASFAAGNGCTASNDAAVAFGRGSQATQGYAFASGAFCQATGSYSFAIGGSSTASGRNSVAMGLSALADRRSMTAFCSETFAAQGDAQLARFVLRQATSSATPATLFLDGSSARLTIPSNKVFGFTVNICGTKQGLGEQSMFVRKGYIKNVAGTTSLIGTIDTIGTDIKTAGATTTDVALTADDTNDALQINVIGVTGENWRWVASVDAVEISY